ncbi:MAG TPA: ABC transporter permease [Ilumatobacter sp.]
MSTPDRRDRGPLGAIDDTIEHAKAHVAGITNPRSHEGFTKSMVTFGSSVVAVLIAFAISGVLLAATGKNPFDAYAKMLDVGLQSSYLYQTAERATPFIISAVAVAIGFKMNLFNIGVEGQFLFGMFWAAVAGAYVSLPQPLHIGFCLLVGALAGAFWAGIAAVLKVTRGVNEVISTIMLNAIALGVLDWLFNDYFRYDDGTGSLDVRTKKLPTSAHMPELVTNRLSGFIFVSLAVAAGFWLLVFKTRFGFRLRASGLNAVAAQTSGISANRMVLMAMLISGAVAGLAGLPYLLGEGFSYGPTRPSGYGFTGIAVALLGRNHPVGIVVAALLYGFLDSVAGPLQLEGIPQSIVQVIQGITLLTVVIVNEVVGRWYTKRTTERAARALAGGEILAVAS